MQNCADADDFQWTKQRTIGGAHNAQVSMFW